MIILGAGNLGQALANYGDFEKRGFRLVGIFDVNPVLEGISVRGIEIQMISGFRNYEGESGGDRHSDTSQEQGQGDGEDSH